MYKLYIRSPLYICSSQTYLLAGWSQPGTRTETRCKDLSWPSWSCLQPGLCFSGCLGQSWDSGGSSIFYTLPMLRPLPTFFPHWIPKPHSPSFYPVGYEEDPSMERKTVPHSANWHPSYNKYPFIFVANALRGVISLLYVYKMFHICIFAYIDVTGRSIFLKHWGSFNAKCKYVCKNV